VSVVIVVCCQVEVSAMDLSLIQRSPTDCGAPLCVIKKPQNEEAKALYRTVKVKPQWIVTPGKQTNKYSSIVIPWIHYNSLQHSIHTQYNSRYNWL